MTEALMPDAVNALEQRLRHEATAGRAPEPDRRLWPRRAALVIPFVVVGALLLVFLLSPTSPQGVRDEAPLILQTAAVRVPSVIDDLQRGATVPAVLGPNARLTDARPVHALGSTAYVVTGDEGWCLVVPDPALTSASDHRTATGVTCSRLAHVERYGISMIVGHNALAAIPQGVPNPTVTFRDGALRELKPTDQGVVAVDDLPSGSVFTIYAKDRSEVSLHSK